MMKQSGKLQLTEFILEKNILHELSSILLRNNTKEARKS